MKTRDQTQGNLPLMSASTKALNMFLGYLPRQSVEVDRKKLVERYAMTCPTSVDMKLEKNDFVF